MKSPLSVSVSFALIGAIPAAVSLTADAASKPIAAGRAILFKEQVIEGRNHAAPAASMTTAGAGDDHDVAGVIASQPRLSLSSDTEACEGFVQALWNCETMYSGTETDVHNCAMCFMNTVDPQKYQSCALKETDWCVELNRCWRSNCKSDCIAKVVDEANCILAANRCSGQCSKSAMMSLGHRAGASGRVVAVVAIGAGLVQLL